MEEITFKNLNSILSLLSAELASPELGRDLGSDLSFAAFKGGNFVLLSNKLSIDELLLMSLVFNNLKIRWLKQYWYLRKRIQTYQSSYSFSLGDHLNE